MAYPLTASSLDKTPLRPEPLAALSALIESHIKEQRYPGCQIALAHDGKLVLDKSFGMARIGQAHAADTVALPARSDSLWLLYSNTKVIVATALWKLHEQGHLRFTDKVTDHLPEFGRHSKEAITLFQVITHQGGFPDREVPSSVWHDHAQVRQAVCDFSLQWAPGSRIQYHGLSAHWVLAMVIEAVTGQDFRTYITDAILRPLGLENDLFMGLPETQQSRMTYLYEPAATALRNSRQLLTLINDLLLLSRDEPIKSADIRVPVEIVPVIEDIIRLHSYSAAQKGIRFHFVRGILDKPVVEGDEKLFRRVLENIVANAVKYSDGAGKVTVSVTGNNDTVTVSVADTGRGIDSADMPHIFERYFQTQRKDTPFEGGTGIGLSIAREIMDLFGGNIRVESEVGKGSIFHLDFPVPEQLSATGSQTGVVMQSVRVNTPLEALKRRKIYVVDDNPEIGKFLSDTLGDDFDITVFFSGNSLLNHLKDSAVPDLLICDLMMPGMNGFELMEHIRNCAAYDSMKILVLTAMTSSDTEERALSCGASAVLWKPFSLDDMKHRIIGLFSDSQMPDVFTPLASDLSEEQMEWLGQLNRLILSKMTAADFTVEWLAQNMHVSRSTLFRELNKLTGQTPNEYIQGIRLEYARRLFESGNVTSVAEVLSAVGLKDKIHFSRIYRDRFGKSPHTYI